MPLEIIVGAVVGAAVANEPVRRKLRQGLVYGLAGVLVAYDKVAHLTQSAVKGARQVVNENKDVPPAPVPVEQPAVSIQAGTHVPAKEAKVTTS